jgi:murein DD-endopeptidase MepM/ murein hydrolase activator NlpD
MRWRPRSALATACLVAVLVATPLGRSSSSGSRLRALAAASTAPVPMARGWFRAPVFHGMAFPLARSNDLSLIEIEQDWHDPRLRLIDGRWRLVGVHEGIDTYAEQGTPVLSMIAGRVENVGWTFYSGLRVGVRGSDGRYYFYAHLSAATPGLGVGTAVQPGTILGLVGNTGYGDPGTRDEFPPHLHFGIEVGSTWVDPYSTLVSLYASTVRTQARWQATLDRLAASGRTTLWRRRATALYVRPGFAPRE